MAKKERKENRTRECQLCHDDFQRSDGGFESICNPCTRENDNQTLEAVLSLPGNAFLDEDGMGAAVEHTSTCQTRVDPELDCSCGAADIDARALDFSEAMN
jgi:hypothetical protein